MSNTIVGLINIQQVEELLIYWKQVDVYINRKGDKPLKPSWYEDGVDYTTPVFQDYIRVKGKPEGDGVIQEALFSDGEKVQITINNASFQNFFAKCSHQGVEG